MFYPQPQRSQRSQRPRRYRNFRQRSNNRQRYDQVNPWQPSQWQPSQWQPSQWQPSQWQSQWHSQTTPQWQPSQWQSSQWQPSQWQPSQWQLQFNPHWFSQFPSWNSSFDLMFSRPSNFDWNSNNRLNMTRLNECPLSRCPVFKEKSPLAFPNLTLDETKTGYTYSFDVPGVQEKDLHISVDNRRVTLSGERKDETTSSHYSESTFGRFTRIFTLPVNADESTLKYELQDGVFRVIVSKTLQQQTPQSQQTQTETQQTQQKQQTQSGTSGEILGTKFVFPSTISPQSDRFAFSPSQDLQQDSQEDS